MIDYLAKRYFRMARTIERMVLWFQIFDSRMNIRSARRMIVRKKGRSVVGRKLKKVIKAYARERFGSTSYWPGVALAAEIRGEYIHGWIPFDWFYFKLEPRLNPPEYANIGDIRTLDYRRFGDFAIKPLFLYISEFFYTPDCEPVEVPELLKFLAGYNNTIVVKQEFGWGGKQVRVMHSSGFKPEQFQKGRNFIIQPFLKQHRILQELYPHSVNTFRVFTFRKKNGSVEVLLTYLRFGVDGTRVDNMSSGGGCVYFDLSGKPGNTGFDYWGFKTGEFHKNTGYRFADLKIPMFRDILDICTSNHQKYPHVRLIGWDIAVDESGEPKLIEWNTQRPSFDWEDAMFGPFFPDDSEFEWA